MAGPATAGIVIDTGEDLPETPSPAREWIAVSLELRLGHSGGPLVDVHGRLVGVNTMMAGPQVGMAVPVHMVKEFLRRELGSGGTTAWLGIHAIAATPKKLEHSAITQNL